MARARASHQAPVGVGPPLQEPCDVPGRLTQKNPSAFGWPVAVVAGVPSAELGGLHQTGLRLPPTLRYMGPLPLSEVLTMKCLPPVMREIRAPKRRFSRLPTIWVAFSMKPRTLCT